MQSCNASSSPKTFLCVGIIWSQRVRYLDYNFLERPDEQFTLPLHFIFTFLIDTTSLSILSFNISYDKKWSKRYFKSKNKTYNLYKFYNNLLRLSYRFSVLLYRGRSEMRCLDGLTYVPCVYIDFINRLLFTYQIVGFPKYTVCIISFILIEVSFLCVSLKNRDSLYF